MPCSRARSPSAASRARACTTRPAAASSCARGASARSMPRIRGAIRCASWRRGRSIRDRISRIMRFETKAIHSGAEIDGESGGIAPPIHLSTTFERRAEDGQPSHGYSYIRDHNPTQTRLEEALAAIEGGEAALAFASGMAAAAAVFQALPAGSHVILPDDGYYAVR